MICLPHYHDGFRVGARRPASSKPDYARSAGAGDPFRVGQAGFAPSTDVHACPSHAVAAFWQQVAAMHGDSRRLRIIERKRQDDEPENRAFPSIGAVRRRRRVVGCGARPGGGSAASASPGLVQGLHQAGRSRYLQRAEHRHGIQWTACDRYQPDRAQGQDQPQGVSGDRAYRPSSSARPRSPGQWRKGPEAGIRHLLPRPLRRGGAS